MYHEKNKLITLLAAAIAVVACNKEEEKVKVSFETALPVMSDNVATLTLKVENYNSGMGELTIPVIFSSANGAEKDVDYTVSAEAFVYGGAKDITTITVTALSYDSSKSVTAAFDLSNGEYAPGQYISTVISLPGKIGYVSFDGSTAEVMESGTVNISVYDGNGSLMRLEQADQIAVTVNTEKSTAVEGTNFKFIDDKKYAAIAANKNSGTVGIELLGNYDEAHNKVVLDLDLTGKYSGGQTTQIAITINSVYSKIGGTWVINQLVTDVDNMQELWYNNLDAEKMAQYWPKFNAADEFTIDLATSKFTPNFQSELKNYFIGESSMTKSDPITLKLEMMADPETAICQMIELDNVNRCFDATKTSESKLGYIAVRLITDQTTNEELLDFYVIDHEFDQFKEDLWINTSKRPTSDGPGYAIRITFKKKAN